MVKSDHVSFIFFHHVPIAIIISLIRLYALYLTAFALQFHLGHSSRCFLLGSVLPYYHLDLSSNVSFSGESSQATLPSLIHFPQHHSKAIHPMLSTFCNFSKILLFINLHDYGLLFSTEGKLHENQDLIFLFITVSQSL